VRKALCLLGCLATVVFAGCTGESNRPVATGEGSIRAINAIKTSPALSILIEERRIGNVEYKLSTNPASYDDLEYTFNFEAILAGDILSTRVASQLLDVVKDTEYTFLISGALAAPDITVWEIPIREWTGTETVFELRIAHTADSLGDVDVYFAPPGTAPVQGNAVGTLSFGEVLPPADYESGNFVLIYTAPGNPSIVRFESNEFSLIAQTSTLLSIFEGDANDTYEWSGRAFFAAGGSGLLTDVRSTSTARFYHASTALLTADIYDDEALPAPPLVTNHAFQDVTDDLDFLAGTTLLFYTAAGNSGAPLFDTQVATFPGSHRHLYVIGAIDTLVSIAFVPDRRSVETQVRFSFLNTGLNHPLVNLYIIETGTDITDAFPVLVNQALGELPNTFGFREGDFDIYLTPAGSKTIVTGPIAISTVLGDVFEYIAYDNLADPMIVDLVSIPLP